MYFFSCTKDNNTNLPPPGRGDGSVAGVITDLNNNPVNNATVVGGTATTTTDANGKFTLAKVPEHIKLQSNEIESYQNNNYFN